jgi:hypothetical protein
MLLLGVVVAPALSRASTMQQGQGQGPRTVTIPPNGSVMLKVRGFCLDFGEPFPTGQTGASGLADAKIRQALNYAIGKGYTEGNPDDVQNAIWFLRDGQWRIENRTIAQEIVDNATDANNPIESASGVSLAEAVSSGRVSITATFVPQTQDAFYGDGDAEVKNLTAAELQIYMPIGTVFTASGGGNFQDLIAYELATQQTEVQQTPQVTVEPTVTLQPTAEPTLTAVVETPAPTSVPIEPAPEEIPAAGSGDTVLALILLVIVLGFGSVAAGLAMRRART